jgi:hypothetical protein
MLEMHRDKNICHSGFSKDCIVKLDIAKLLHPKEWGWRFVAFDFVMPNHQLVECYIVFAELESAKKMDDPLATVCPALSNHEVWIHPNLYMPQVIVCFVCAPHFPTSMALEGSLMLFDLPHRFISLLFVALLCRFLRSGVW